MKIKKVGMRRYVFSVLLLPIISTAQISTSSITIDNNSIAFQPPTENTIYWDACSDDLIITNKVDNIVISTCGSGYNIYLCDPGQYGNYEIDLYFLYMGGSDEVSIYYGTNLVTHTDSPESYENGAFGKLVGFPATNNSESRWIISSYHYGYTSL